MKGLTKRRLYRRERPAARFKGVLDKQAPIDCPDANKKEIALAIAAFCHEARVIVGRGGTYDPFKDEYTVIGKVLDGGIDRNGVYTGRVQDVTIKGEIIAALINIVRRANGGMLVSGGLAV